MRAITADMADAFWAGKPKRRSNSEVFAYGGEVIFFLHGNAIARRPFGMDRLEITAAGWFTNTTKERLNGILRHVNASISQSDFIWYISYSPNGEPIVEEMGSGWVLAHPGSDLEQIAMVTKEASWNEGRV